MPDDKKRNNKKSSSGGGFQNLGLCDEVYRGITRIGFRVPTPVQRKSLPVALSGVDTVCMARTGSGKTAAFVIPILHRLLTSTFSPLNKSSNGIRAVILSPTRELSNQTLRVVQTLSHFSDLNTIQIVGGEGMEKQFGLLSSSPDILLATPGRLAHHLTEIPDFHLKNVQMMVFDEADRLFEMGFAMQIREICSSIGDMEGCQTMLFSATMPKQLAEFTKVLKDPVVIRMEKEVSVSPDLRIGFFLGRSADKDASLLLLLREVIMKRKPSLSEEDKPPLTLIFVGTRHHVEYLTLLLRQSNIPTEMIYGTMDHEARKSSLASFRSGKTPVLIVTDVAARGIDIPHLDFVVHYHFPSSAKLFVHRSGRAARIEGRKGYAFGFVDAEEVGYVMDLHSFLGRKVSNGLANTKIVQEGEEVKEEIEEKERLYNLDEMTPDDVHIGRVPEGLLNEEKEDIVRIIKQDEDLKNLERVSNNGLKQYKRSRTECSRAGWKRGKAFLAKETNAEGLELHPLLKKVEIQKLIGKTNAKEEDVKNYQDQQDFLKQLKQFRPKETIFEAFSSNTYSSGVQSQVDKGRTTDTGIAAKTTLTVMKSMRRQMRLATEKSRTLVVAGSETAQKINEDSDDDDDDDRPSRNEKNPSPPVPVAPAVTRHKKGLTKAQRKALKTGKSPSQSSQSSNNPPSTYKDTQNYISTDMDPTTHQTESSLQPSQTASKDFKTTAMTIQSAMLDIVGDENAEMVKQHRILRWDKSKRKYMQTTLGDEMEGMSRTKKVKLESGKFVKGKELKLGELYEKWQKKTNKSIGRVGILDEEGMDEPQNDETSNRAALLSSNTVKKSNKKGPKKMNASSDKTDSSGPKSIKDIQKSRAEQQKQKFKNMKKDDRRKLVTKLKQKKTDEQELRVKKTEKKGHQGKKGASGRWAKK